ncbi:MAG: hypothetical protein D6768_03705 [Chloroflexi bacterium]|nr:MAG: hypothetical protein D6768_03705 [Chloroflexota bacterium]
MLTELTFIANFIIDSFLHIWPYLLITIPLAVAVNMSGASKYINRAFSARPVTAIFLATAVGAFSPFCSCGVIPVVAALLIGGVPLAPVMAFWIASPSMDPEAFFLSVATIGWELAVWRLAATLALSLSAGFVTHLLMQRGWLGTQILRTQAIPQTRSQWELLQQVWQRVKSAAASLLPEKPAPAAAFNADCCAPATIGLVDEWMPAPAGVAPSNSGTCGCGPANPEAGGSCSLKPASFRQRLFDETWAATVMVIKFMLLAFFLEALIIRYVPAEWIAGLLGQDNPWAIAGAALIGVPVYTTNLAALPLVSGLLVQGMSGGAALAFLVAGPTTTLPAMAAVWGLTTRRVFGLYLAFSLVGAMLLGYIFQFATLF